MGARRPRSRHAGRPSGQHLLRSRVLARELVEQARVGPGDLVVEIGAGTGVITRALADAARRVVAVELDPDFADLLRGLFGNDPRVQIVEGDVLKMLLPRTPFRAFGNIPFDLSTAILRRLLDDPESPLLAVDVLVQYEAARKRSTPWPTSLTSLGWLPWWELALVRRVPSSAFEPPPGVDAGLLTVRRRPTPLLEPKRREEFVRLVRLAFRRADLPVRRSLRHAVGDAAWRRLAASRGLPRGARAIDLDVFDWVAVFSVAHP